LGFSFGPFEKNPWPFKKFLNYATESGFDGVEIIEFRPHSHPDDYDTADKCSELVKEIADPGLAISGYAPDFSAVPPVEVETQSYLDEINKSSIFCEQCGIKLLRVDSVSPPCEISLDKYKVKFDRLVKTWHAAAELCRKRGVFLVWEFEPGF
jgi:sugar phosphate isomerase/epimerase